MCQRRLTVKYILIQYELSESVCPSMHCYQLVIWCSSSYSNLSLIQQVLAMPSSWCRHQADMIMTYNLLHHNLDVDPTKLFTLWTASLTRGHNYKLYMPHAPKTIQNHFFTIRIINHWNNLPWATVNSSSVNTFNSKRILMTTTIYLFILFI